MMESDVLIIGSGISALTSAVILAQKGLSVVVLEQAAKPGGYMHSFRRFGQLYDTGAHYVGAMGPGQPFRVLLEYLGVYKDELFCPLDFSGFDVFHFPSGKVEMPQGYANVISELSAIFPNERSAIEKYFAMIARMIKFFPTYDFNDESNLDIPAEAFEASLGSVVESLTSDRKLQSVLYAYCNLHGVIPHETAFGFHAIVTDSLIRGPYGLGAGGDALTKSFTDRIEALGGKILLKSRVTEIRVVDRNVSEVVTQKGESYRAKWVISSIHPKQTFGLLNDRAGFTPAFFDRLNGLKESVAIFGVYSAVTKPANINPAKNYYFFRTDDPDAYNHERGPEEEPNIVFMTSPQRHWLSGAVKNPLCLHAPGPMPWFHSWRDDQFGKRSQDYNDFKMSYTNQIFSLAEKYNPQLGESLRDGQHVSSSALTNIHFNSAEDGSSYGIYHSIQNTGPRAMGPRTKVLNLLLTGQNYLFPGLMGAAVSALRTCGHIVGMKPILTELKNRGQRL